MQKKSGSRTLLMSVIMSAPGPLVVGLGLLAGKSATQLADFFRRSAELLAIIVAFIVYRATNKDGAVDEARKARLEHRSNLFVGAMMCVSGAVMLLLAALGGNAEKGNVIPGLVIALLGVIANTIFWLRYTKLSRQSGNAILAVQGRLYRAKALVDICVTMVLLSVALFPLAKVTGWLDRIGSVIVALYLMGCGVKTIRENQGKG
ncbi:MAG: cation transporter [Clostridia bacterium]|nr:cation transporter [Clostridia bacterium]